jgi:hypothetical protein
MIKYSIAHEICEPNLEWNSNNRQNKEIIEFVEVDFLEFFLSNFGEKFEMESSLRMLL